MDTRLNKYNSNVGVNLNADNLNRCVLFSPAMKKELIARWNGTSPHRAPAYDEKSSIESNVNALKSNYTIYNEFVETSILLSNGVMASGEANNPSVTQAQRLLDWGLYHFLFQEQTQYGGRNIGEWVKQAIIEQFEVEECVAGSSFFPYSVMIDNFPYTRWGVYYCQMALAYSFTADVWTQSEKDFVWSKLRTGFSLFLRAFELKYMEPYFPMRYKKASQDNYDPSQNSINFIPTSERNYLNGVVCPEHGTGLGFDNSGLWGYLWGGVIHDCIFGGNYFIKRVKNVLKDYLAFCFNADNDWIYQTYRAETTNEERGYTYFHNQLNRVALIMYMIWLNKGDTELITYSTTFGDGQTNSTTPKNMERLFTHWLKWVDGTYTRYVNNAPEQTLTYKIDGFRRATPDNRVSWMDVPAMTVLENILKPGDMDSIRAAKLRNLDGLQEIDWKQGNINRESMSSFGHTIHGLRPMFCFWRMGDAIFK